MQTHTGKVKIDSLGRDMAFARQVVTAAVMKRARLVVTAAVKRGKRARLVGTCCHKEADLLVGLVG